MKFSSISLITAGLAAIAGSTIAAPAPLHARALIVDNLFKRQNDWQKKHLAVAKALYHSSIDNYHTSVAARTTSMGPTHEKTPAEWARLSDILVKISQKHATESLKHFDAANKPKKGLKYKDLHKDFCEAIRGQALAADGKVLAIGDRREREYYHV